MKRETPVDLYNNVYSGFGSDEEIAVRRQTYGEDIGQSSWMTASEWLRFADQLGVTAASEVLEVGSGSGGPAIYLALKRGCRVTGVDINEHGVRNAIAMAADRAVADRVDFRVTNASATLPFPAACFDAIVSNDAMCHIDRRIAVLREWCRVVCAGRRALFTDAMVITGPVSHEELAIRSSIGFYLFVPPGENERLLREAGFELLGVDDLTGRASEISQRWCDAREEHREALIMREGPENFQGLQRFLRCVHTLSMERRLSRYSYLAQKK